MVEPQNLGEGLSLAGMRILIVDDSPDEREIFSLLLSRSGAEVVTAATVAEALERFEVEPPNVVISDISLPDRDGFDFMRTVRSLPPESGGRVTAIAMTGWARDADRRQSLEAGFDFHLSKPVEFSTLLATIASCTGRIEETRRLREEMKARVREQRALREKFVARREGVLDEMARLEGLSIRRAGLVAENAAVLSGASAAVARTRQVLTPDRLAINYVLAALPPAELRAIAAYFEPALLAEGQILDCVGEPGRHVYFPISSVLAKQCVFESGKVVEAAQIGRDGLTGIGLIFGDPVTKLHTRVQVGGEAARLGADAVAAALAAAPSLLAAVMRYTRVSRAEIAQTAACNRLHHIGGQLPTWLLSVCDKLGRDSLRLTHESIASSLGTRRASVTVALGELQNDGLVRCARGRVEIVDRRGLARAACECYPATRALYGGPTV